MQSLLICRHLRVQYNNSISITAQIIVQVLGHRQGLNKESLLWRCHVCHGFCVWNTIILTRIRDYIINMYVHIRARMNAAKLRSHHFLGPRIAKPEPDLPSPWSTIDFIQTILRTRMNAAKLRSCDLLGPRIAKPEPDLPSPWSTIDFLNYSRADECSQASISSFSGTTDREA